MQPLVTPQELLDEYFSQSTTVSREERGGNYIVGSLGTKMICRGVHIITSYVCILHFFF